MRSLFAVLFFLTVLAVVQGAVASAPGEIKDPEGKFLVWNDYKIEINQYDGLGRDWPYEIVWQQYDLLTKRAAENTQNPNTIKGVLLVCPTTHATAYEGEKEVGEKTTSMTSNEVKWAIDQWRQWEEMIYVYSGGAAWQRTDMKVIDEPLEVRTNATWHFWSGPKRNLIDKYIPFERGDYDSYNSIYNSKDLNAGPWGGTFGADIGPLGCGSSDNAWLSRGKNADERQGFVFWHEWLNQMCWATSNVMPYPQELWSLYVFHDMGYRSDPINAWPWITSHRDMMRFIIRPGMWSRWTVTDPYVSPAIDTWEVFGPEKPGLAKEFSDHSLEGNEIFMKLGTYGQFDLNKAESAAEATDWKKPEIAEGTYYFRCFVASDKKQDVRLWAGADERFQLWLNGAMIRDGWGTLRSGDQGRLIEKVTYTTLEAGMNTLVLALPNVDEKSKDVVEFRVRFCRTDGSGEMPEGVTINRGHIAGSIVPLQEVPAPDFKKPKLYKWADIGDDPWLKLPRMDEAALRDLTGIGGLSLKTEHVLGTEKVKNREGKEVEREIVEKQHLFLDVPKDSVASPWIAEPTENSQALNNDLDYNWESMAWLRVPGRAGEDKDVLLVRFDVAEPVLHLLKTKGRPANESIVGYMLVKFKIAYVVLVNLDGAPTKELGALSKQPE